MARLRQGLIREVVQLKRAGLSPKRLEDLGLEYRYINRYLEAKLTKSEMLAELEKEIVRYAKRQMTWFKRDKEIHWIKNTRQVEYLTEKFLKS